MDSKQGIEDFLEDTDPSTIVPHAALVDVEAGSLADVSGQSPIGTCTGTTHDDSDFGAENKSDNAANGCLKNVKLIDNANGNTEDDEDNRELQVSASSPVNADSNINESLLEVAMQGLSPQSDDDKSETFSVLPQMIVTFSGGTDDSPGNNESSKSNKTRQC